MSNSKSSTPTHDEVELEPYRTTPNGGQAARCQTVRKGKQCGQYARTGFNACWRCGAGSKKRETAGEKRKAGRPLVTGLYSHSTLTLHDLVKQVGELQVDFDNTDQELAVARAVLWQLLNDAPDAPSLQEQMQSQLDNEETDYLDAKEVARQVIELGHYSDRLSASADRITRMVKLRADTDAKLAEAKALEAFTQLALIVKGIMREMLEPAQYEIFCQRLQTEVMAKAGVKLEKDKKLPN